MSPPARRPLAGFAIGITGHRRWEEQAEMLSRRGARIVHGPTMATELLGDLDATVAATEQVISDRVDTVVLSTGFGTRSWFAAAESAGLDDTLRAALAGSEIVARGPKALNAARAAGLEATWTAPTETNNEVLAHLTAGGLAGRRLVVQRDGGEPLMARQLAELGAAEIIDVPIYRWHLPEDRTPALRLLDGATHGHLDAITFTCSYAVHNTFELCTDEPALLDAFASDVLAVAVGPVTARALRERGIERVLEPPRARLGSMVHALVGELAGRTCTLRSGDAVVHWQGSTLIDGEGRETDLTPGEVRLLRVLLDRAPNVVGKPQLAEPGTDDHAAEAAVARLRVKLGPLGEGIRTVRRRGYACTLQRSPV